MSRREFRSTTTSPRPRAAIAMVGIATLSLGLTGEIQAFALVAAAVAIATVTWLGDRQLAWQRSPWLLNLGLLLCLVVAGAIWLRGTLALIALAHFAILTQALQLLDARPRRSEFLLVALALFQVILAANLTESALFPLLLLAFTGATIWTLLLHTLHAEALEAGEPAHARPEVGDGLRRTILMAGLTSVAIALVLFPLLPRLRVGALLGAGGGNGLGVSGFSEQVALGDLGRIRFDHRVVLRVETVPDESDPGAPQLAASERYMRGLAFDHFDGRRWSVTPPGRERVVGDPVRGVRVAMDPKPRRHGPRIVQRVAREAIDSGVLFAPGRLLGVRGSLGRLELDSGGALHAHRTAGVRVDYSVTSRLAQLSDAALAHDHVRDPDPQGRHLALPELAPIIAERAREVTRDAPHDAARVRALESWLRSAGRYSDRPPVVSADDARSPVEVFLAGGLAGHCEYFASAMVLMARSLGIPARVVNGFAGGSDNRLGGFVEYAHSDAHTWVEVHYADAGWIRYDPTPPDLRLAGADALRAGGGLQALLSAAELWWFRNVVDFDRSTQARAIRSLWQRWKALRPGSRGRDLGGADTPGPKGGSRFDLDADMAVWLVPLAALALGLAVFAVRRRGAEAAAIPEYQAALRLLARRGLRRAPSEPARGFARRVARSRPDAAESFEALTGAYLATRFGGHPAPALEETLAALRRALRHRRVEPADA